MTFSDLFKMCLQNLKRRKSRTFLTTLGVIIGCTSIMVMMSIGMAVDKSQKKMLEDMGDLRIISIYPNYEPDAQGLNESAIEQFSNIPGVQAAIGKMEIQDFPVEVVSGSNERYKTTFTNVVGVDFLNIENLGYELLEGSLPSQAVKNQALVGKQFAYSFMDTARPEGSNMINYYDYLYDENGNEISKEEMPEPYVDPLKDKLTLKINIGDDNNQSIDQEIRVTGVVNENYNLGIETSQGLIVNMDLLKEMYKEAKSKANMPQTPLQYSSAVVKAQDISQVKDIEQEIRQLGYQTSSMESVRQSMEESTKLMQMVLGGIGAVSLFVAAIGITNTMIMSITERTREIGIMKALGCFTKNIRQLFLMEAGVIGLIGGLIGIVLSYLVSMILNFFANSSMEITSFSQRVLVLLGLEGTPLSYIPLWLAFFSLIFSCAIGIAAGFYPANKAVKIPALEAIKYN